LADLHAVDWRAQGLQDFGRPEGFNDRHRRRIAQVVPDSRFVELDGWLATHVPDESAAAIVHNDYRIGNVVLSAERPGEIVAVLDWELATIGDPLLDLGYFLASIPDDDGPLTPTQHLSRAMLEPGYPTRKELADRYAVRTGAQLERLNWYTTFALWKLAVLYEYSRRQGQDPYYADPAHVQSFLTAARRAAGLEM
jgi:aminoglycoside phosphotransferase (APT) family kinase protein